MGKDKQNWDATLEQKNLLLHYKKTSGHASAKANLEVENGRDGRLNESSKRVSIQTGQVFFIIRLV